MYRKGRIWGGRGHFFFGRQSFIARREPPPAHGLIIFSDDWFGVNRVTCVIPVSRTFELLSAVVARCEDDLVAAGWLCHPWRHFVLNHVVPYSSQWPQLSQVLLGATAYTVIMSLPVSKCLLKPFQRNTDSRSSCSTAHDECLFNNITRRSSPRKLGTALTRNTPSSFFRQRARRTLSGVLQRKDEI